MLNDIRMHVERDEDAQQKIEQQKSHLIEQNFHHSMRSFLQHIPNVHQQLNNIVNSPFALFVNKHAQFNIVDYASGKTLYGLNPENEIEYQVEHYHQRCNYVSLSIDVTNVDANGNLSRAKNHAAEQHNAYTEYVINSNNTKALIEKDDNDVLAILGIGLGLHILPLLRKIKPKHVILYETELAILRASTLAHNWQLVLDYAAQNNISIYFQFGNGVSNPAAKLFKDVVELTSHFECKNLLIFKHFDSVVYNSVASLANESSWTELQKIEHVSPPMPSMSNDVPVWNSGFDTQSWQIGDHNHPLFQKNLTTLEKVYPELYQRFKHYQPQDWQVLVHCNDDCVTPSQKQNKHPVVNLFNVDNQVALHGNNSKQESCALFDNFNQHPNQDGLVIGYRGEKNRHFLHNHFVIQTESILNRLENNVEVHPDQSKALIMFGLGAGYGFEQLVQTKTIEQLFVFEPNPDFFYSSLFAIDWQLIFDKVESDDSYLYLNIGDDGSNFAGDMMAHFYRIGPYVLNETFLFKGYENQVLNPIVNKLREQLKLMIAMSENFDHSVAGVQQTLESIKHNVPFLSANCVNVLSEANKETPIFVVGNGPSLDVSIEAIKECKEQVIVVSCGTALQSLYKSGITPDFHAEIEQYRSTFDWASLIDAPDYLKQITLLSCNGIHPDTSGLYKNVRLAFKQGEASTRAIQDLVGQTAFTTLETAYPTVSNFALSFFLASGFRNIYMIGTDLGFVDVNHHHSKNSGYFDSEGNARLDFAEMQNVGLLVKGNFRPFVNTKVEFDLARMSMEKAIEVYAATACYNTSDGALIKGASPLDIDAILILTAKQDKQQTLAAYADCFVQIDNTRFMPAFEKRYNAELLHKGIDTLVEMSLTKFDNAGQIRPFIEDVRQLVLDNYESELNKQSSLFFFYYHSMTNSINALLTKVMMQDDDAFATESANKILAIWHTILLDTKAVCHKQFAIFDTSSSFIGIRERQFLLAATSSMPINLVGNGVIDGHDMLKQINGLCQKSLITSHEEVRLGMMNIVFIDCLTTFVELTQQYSRINDDTRFLWVISGVTAAWNQSILQNIAFTHYCVMCTPKLLSHYDSDDLKAGYVPILPEKVAVIEAIKRSFDASDYALFLQKPRFSKAGLKTAYDQGLDEFSTVACSFIDENFVSLIEVDHFYDFKTHVALSRIFNQDTKKQGTVENQLRSRGQLFERHYRARDLLGIWLSETSV